MLELRYMKATGLVTGWCGDPEQFGKLDRGRDTEDVVTLVTDVPDGPPDSLKSDGDKLVPNPDYVPPLPPRDAIAEIEQVRQDAYMLLAFRDNTEAELAAMKDRIKELERK